MIDVHVADQQPLRIGNAAAAIIIVEGAGYLLQLRDSKPGIVFPGYWSLFGGAMDPREKPEEALRRELEEELGLVLTEIRPFGCLSFDLRRMGLKRLDREFFEVHLQPDDLQAMRLGEGAEAKVFTREEVLALPRLAPYDAFALWVHANRLRLHN